MSVDPLAMPAAGAADPDAGRMGVLALTVDVIRRPAAAMARIALRPKWRWFPPLVALAIVSVPVSIIGARQAIALQASTVAVEAGSGEGFRSGAVEQGEDGAEIGATQAAAAQRTGMVAVVGGVVAGVIGAFLVPLVAAGVLHFLSTVLGGQQSFAEMFATASWARVPLILRGVLQLVVFGAGSFDPNPAGLAGLVAPSPLDFGAERSYLEPLLAQVEIWNLWYLALLVVAVGVVARFPRKRALVVVAGFAGLSIGLGLAGIAINNAMSGLMGG